MKARTTLDRLMEEAKADPPPQTVPFAFDSRVMHSIETQPSPDVALAWVAGLWHAVIPCAALALTSVAVTVAVFSKPDTDDGPADLTYLSASSENTDTADAAPVDSTESSPDRLW